MMMSTMTIVVAALVLDSGWAIKERIVFDPQIHKVGPGDDPNFTAVPEAPSNKPSKTEERYRDIGGALDFLTDFSRYQKEHEVEPEVESLYPSLNEDDSAEEEVRHIDQRSNFPYPRTRHFQDLSAFDDDEEIPEESYDQLSRQQFIDSAIDHILAAKSGMGSKIESSMVNTKAPVAAALQHQQHQASSGKSTDGFDFAMIALLTCLAVAAAIGVIVSVFCFVKLQKRSRSTQRFDYSGPGNGAGKYIQGRSNSGDSLSGSAAAAAASKLSAIFGGNSSGSNVDKKLANNATLYHFEHHKKEMMAAESNDVPPEFGDSDADSVDDNDENDYTVYECPGLAPTGEMQVDNPLFRIKQQVSQPSSTGSPPSSARSSPVIVPATSPKE